MEPEPKIWTKVHGAGAENKSFRRRNIVSFQDYVPDICSIEKLTFPEMIQLPKCLFTVVTVISLRNVLYSIIQY